MNVISDFPLRSGTLFPSRLNIFIVAVAVDEQLSYLIDDGNLGNAVE